jgi:tetraacyldisaccharide 4'-kinase
VNEFLQKAWRRRGWRACLLWPVSAVYGWLVQIRGVLKSRRFPKPVVVVGNVVAGGAGKTPVVMALVGHLAAKGLKAGVVSRGYGRAGHGVLEVTTQTPPHYSGDEPAHIKRATGAPVFVADERALAVDALLAAYPQVDVVIADDGLQHHALARDIEVVVFDDRGLGNGWLLPAGPLREPWAAKADATPRLVLHTGLKPAFAGFRSSRQLAVNAYDASGAQTPLHALKARSVVAIAAIANPESFFSMLRSQGVALGATRAWPDHHDFADFDPAVFSGKTILCTEKDAVKLFDLPQTAGLALLAVPLVFAPEEAFYAAFDEALDGVRSSRSPLPSSHGHQTS